MESPLSSQTRIPQERCGSFILTPMMQTRDRPTMRLHFYVAHPVQ